MRHFMRKVWNQMKHHSLLPLMLVLFILSGCSGNDASAAPQISSQQQAITDEAKQWPVVDQSEQKISSNENTANIDDSQNLIVHFIDVGQADCTLLERNGQFMLIDAGNNADSGLIVDYLKKEGVTKLDFAVGTHPHEDHIGSLDTVIDNFEIGTVLMPKVAANTQTFEDVLIALQNKGIKPTAPQAGTYYQFASLPVEILAPINTYDDANNNSIVLKVIDGNVSFLFTGDAEAEAEQDILKSDYDISANVLKVGHHGSDTSTTQEFLDAVKPQYAVICVGADNTYGHPRDETIKKLEAAGIIIHRTDQEGSVTVSTDGVQIEITTEKQVNLQNPSQNQISQNQTSGNQPAPIPTEPPKAIQEPAVPASEPEIQQQEQQSVQETPNTQTPEAAPEPEQTETQNVQNNAITYIGNRNTRKFHRTTCGTLPAQKNRVQLNSREEAINQGYVPCKNCNP